MKGGTEMNAHERGKKLSRIVTGTIGLLAVVAASALGLHDWADSLATQDASATTTTTTTSGDSGTTSGSTTTQATAAPAAPAAPSVSSGSGTKVHAKTSGS
ncbi:MULTISPECIES: hypothetical protein [Cryobacterium]|uniref:Uncharacterized protein n=1 Tax=Cryobacterium glucosi TaxID=1259175 RepID=A0ABY2IUA9_9MICO|nr:MULTISPECIES: hypothetical protein [Cryobacterium]MDY7527127.1 hypothetical protein [Cryobacterium sp. 10C2]MDY7557083.1 hypothetical protein [Cryobacterium sp. 10C3]MEB0003095.1 hypothetical protein [Cryobacterium sp. RTC2.1]MEB0200387.1 hypothetical protein [Cryobacterium sp. 5I3]MEB0286255.1 hypothetical protein [Cryobacterium sp. 10S3]